MDAETLIRAMLHAREKGTHRSQVSQAVASLCADHCAHCEGEGREMSTDAEVADAGDEALAEMYADLFNLLGKAKKKITSQQLHQAHTELSYGDWQVDYNPRKGVWTAVAGADVDEEGEYTLAAERAPKGGISIGGKTYKGGQWIPASVIASLSEEDQTKISDAKVSHSAARRARGNVDVGSLEERLNKHRHTTESKYAKGFGMGEGWESKVVKALHEHHGELLIHRIEELANTAEEAMKSLSPDEVGVKRQFTQRLAAYGRMVKWAKEHGITGQIGPPADAGGVDGAGNSVGNFKPEIVTARKEHTGAADTGVVPEDLRKHLISPDGSDHQLQGAAKAIAALSTVGGFLLADGAGAGKTRQMLAVAATFARQGKKVLMIAPTSIIKDAKTGLVVGSVGKDAAAMGVSLTPNFKGAVPMAAGQVHVTTYEQLANIKGQIDKDTIVMFDEAHGLKNAESARAKHGAAISAAAGGVLYGTATPADQSADVGYLFRASLEPPPWAETKKAITPKKGREEDAYRATGEMFEKLTAKGLMVKREISLEGLEVHYDHVELSGEQKAELAKIKTDSSKPSEAAQVLMKQRFLQEKHKIPHAVKSIQQELAEGRQVVIFVAGVNPGGGEGGEGGTEGEIPQGPGTAGMLRAALAAAGVSHDDIAELHGGEGGEGKDAVSRFQGKHAEGKTAKVLITTAQSGGTGHNLDDTAGDRPRTQIIMTAPFSAIDNAQIWGRAHRLTTRSKSRMRYMFADTDTDRWNASLIRGKVKGLGAIVAGETAKQDIPEFDQPKPSPATEEMPPARDAEPAPGAPEKQATMSTADWDEGRVRRDHGKFTAGIRRPFRGGEEMPPDDRA